MDDTASLRIISVLLNMVVSIRIRGVNISPNSTSTLLQNKEFGPLCCRGNTTKNKNKKSAEKIAK